MTNTQVESVYALLNAQFKAWVANGARYAGMVKDRRPDTWKQYTTIQDTLVAWLQARKALAKLDDTAASQKIAGDLANQGITLVASVKAFNDCSWWMMKLDWVVDKITLVFKVAYAVGQGIARIMVAIGNQSMWLLRNMPVIALLGAGIWFLGPRLMQSMPGTVRTKATHP